MTQTCHRARRAPRRAALVSTFIAAALAAAASAAEPMCATPAQTETVRAAFAKPKPPAPFAAARELKLPEALVVSALPQSQAYGVAATHFRDVWKSLETWDRAVFVVMKGGHVFEVHGKVFAGEPSKRSNFFNLHGDGAGMSGHLRPDLLASIWVLSPPGEGMRGVLFYDAAGEPAFGIYLPGEGETPSAALVRQFEATAREIRALPALCTASAR